MLDTTLEKYQELSYAARNWGYHARAASAKMEQPILDFLGCAAKVSASSQVIRNSIHYTLHSRSNGLRQMTCVHLAAYFGLERVMTTLLENGHDSDSKDGGNRTPLSWAAGNGHKAVVKLLLAKDGVDPDCKDTEYGLTPLSWAAVNGHEAVVKLLLAKGCVDPDCKDPSYGLTPLSRAVVNGHEG